MVQLTGAAVKRLNYCSQDGPRVAGLAAHCGRAVWILLPGHCCPVRPHRVASPMRRSADQQFEPVCTFYTKSAVEIKLSQLSEALIERQDAL